MAGRTPELDRQMLITSGKAVACSWCGETYIAKRVNRTSPNYCSVPCRNQARNRVRRQGPNPAVIERRTQAIIDELKAENAELRQRLAEACTTNDPCARGCRMRIQLLYKYYGPPTWGGHYS